MGRKRRYERVYSEFTEIKPVDGAALSVLTPVITEVFSILRHSVWMKLRGIVDDFGKRGYTVDGLLIATDPYLDRLVVSFPIETNVKEYLPAIRACQERLQELHELWKQDKVVAWLADEHGKGRTYEELAKELNKMTRVWAGLDPDNPSGELDRLSILIGLDHFLRAEGITPEDCELFDDLYEGPFDAEQVGRKVRYFHTKK